LRHTLLDKRGISIIEILLVTLIISLLMGSIFYIFSVAQSLRLFSTAKIEAQAEIRRAMDWIVNDVRQTVSYSIGAGGVAGNDPSSAHIKFKKVIDYDTAGSGSALLGNFIEYTYDPNANTITRTDLDTNQNWIFSNIVLNEPPFDAGVFYTRLSSGEIVAIDPIISGDNSPVYQTGNLVVVLTGQKQANASENVNCVLKEEVKIRN
jgi:type II secretory pathway pseudopilin PulG